MRLSRVICDGCGRIPRFFEWIRGELSVDGYIHWRHPAIAFREAGFSVTYDNRGKAERLFVALFGRDYPEQDGLLCPDCQQLASEELPALVEADQGEDLRATPRHYIG